MQTAIIDASRAKVRTPFVLHRNPTYWIGREINRNTTTTKIDGVTSNVVKTIENQSTQQTLRTIDPCRAILELKEKEEVSENLRVMALSITQMDLSSYGNLTPENLYNIFKLFKNLESLTLRGDDSCLSGIEGLCKLRELDLFSSMVTDIGLKEVAKLKKLHMLRLENTDIGDLGLKALSILPDLRSLYLCNTRVTCSNVELAKQFPLLEMLDLENTNISEDGIRELSELSNLKYLKLKRTKVIGLEYISRISTLEKLDLCNSEVLENDLLAFKKLPNLKWVGLRNSTIFVMNTSLTVGKLVAELAGLKHLDDEDIQEYLENEGIEFVSIESLSPASVVSQIEELSPGSRMVDDSELDSSSDEDYPEEKLLEATYSILKLIQNGEDVSRKLGFIADQVTDLDLSKVHWLTEKELTRVVEVFCSVECIHMPPHTDKTLLNIISNLQIKDLSLKECFFSDDDLSDIGEFSLEDLNLSSTQITDRGLYFVSQIKTLKRLILSDTKITDKGLLLISHIEKLKYLNLDNTEVTDIGLKILSYNKNFIQLSVKNCNVTEMGAKKAGWYYRDIEVISNMSRPLMRDILFKKREVNNITRKISALAIDHYEFKHKGKSVEEVENLYELDKSIAELILSYDFDPTDMILELVTKENEVPQYLKSLALYVTKLNLTTNAGITFEHFAYVARIFKNVTSLNMPTQTDDKFLSSISSFNLVDLDLSETDISDKVIEEVSKLSKLKSLNLNTCSITDSSVVAISEIMTIEKLDLGCTKITGKYLKSLSKLPKLAFLNLENCNVTETEALEAQLSSVVTYGE